MAYGIDVSVSTLKQVMYSLQYMLRDVNMAGWTYIDGMVGGVVTTPGVSGPAWLAVSDPDTELLDGDYVVLQAPVVTGADNGVVSLWLVDGGSKYLELQAHPAGWDATTHTSKDATQDLGGSTCIVCGDSDVSELRVIVNSKRAIIFGMDALLTPYYFGYLGFIQSHYGDVEVAPDTNPLLVTGGQYTPGVAGAPMSMLSAGTTPTPTQYFVNGPTTLKDTAGDVMLETMQWNRRESPPIPTRSLIPCLIGCKTVGETEIRGELEGVFYYGPAASLAEDTPVTRSGATYIIVSDIAVGPVS